MQLFLKFLIVEYGKYSYVFLDGLLTYEPFANYITLYWKKLYI